MTYVVDKTPLPQSLRARIEGLEPGESLLAQAHTLHTLRETVSRVRKKHPSRQYAVRDHDDGARVWRKA